MVIHVVGYDDLVLDSDLPRELTGFISQYQWNAISESMNHSHSSATFSSDCLEYSMCWFFPCIFCYHTKLVTHFSEEDLKRLSVSDYVINDVL